MVSPSSHQPFSSPFRQTSASNGSCSPLQTGTRNPGKTIWNGAMRASRSNGSILEFCRYAGTDL
ncbi:unnamed protein product [Periconia digitata]|uniref:Uncharacterized protein n=1 Tax=Periconia digitata TaxID=1303443 RepID=A0A9W4XXG6_9PLEO|nr:unnamed protein product [Periconia digitata]